MHKGWVKGEGEMARYQHGALGALRVWERTMSSLSGAAKSSGIPQKAEVFADFAFLGCTEVISLH